MHILLYSRSFFPDIGGLETVSMVLARHIARAGHACTVITETSRREGSDDAFPFAVERAPTRRRRLELVRAADVVHSNGASLALFPYAKLARKPLVWTHQGYQMICIDGLGWAYGGPAPFGPLASFRFHARRGGLAFATTGALKLGARRVAARFVDKHVAITQWVADRQRLRNQSVIYNPFPLSSFDGASSIEDAPAFDFVYLGRLVSEKGVPTLLRALRVVNDKRRATLLLVGDGPERAGLERLADELRLGERVVFAGAKSGTELAATVRKGAIGVVPSAWEEAMGGVALELLAAGKALIVSERGGLAECVGDAALTFPNGDHAALAACMERLLEAAPLREAMKRAGRALVPRFDESVLAGKYVELYRELAQR